MDCERKDKNLANCNCTYDCEKKGVCCQCIAYHRAMSQLPACYFSAKAERTYDRSFRKFAEDKGLR
jgi:hypothetical protein